MLDETSFCRVWHPLDVTVPRAAPYELEVNDTTYRVGYDPAESTTDLRRELELARAGVVPDQLSDDRVTAEISPLRRQRFPGGVPDRLGQHVTLREVAAELSRRLTRSFCVTARTAARQRRSDVRPDPHWRDYIAFHEYFHGDTGRGLGASHQTGWTALVAKLLQQLAVHPSRQKEQPAVATAVTEPSGG